MSTATIKSPQRDITKIAKGYIIQHHENKLRAEGTNIEVYFDTYDVIRLVQGIWAFEDGFKLNMNRFKEKATLVHSMAFKGWLGNIHMLAPHQDEFINKLRYQSHQFPPRRDLSFNELEQELLYKLDLKKLVENPNELSENKIKDYVYNLETKAWDLFCANNIFQYPFWYDRYKYLFNEKQCVIIDNTTYNLHKITQTRLFRKFKETFDKLRANREKNNFIDAVAFCLLNNKLNEYKNDKSNKPLPVFYVSATFTLKALKEVIEQENVLTYQNNGETIPIVRSADYFILDAIFNLENQDDNFNRIMTALKDSIKRRIKYHSLFERTRKEDYEVLREVINKKINSEFFDKAWLQRDGFKEMNDAIRDYINLKGRLAKEVVIIADAQRKELTGELERDADRFEIINGLLYELSDIRGYVKTLKHKKVNIFFDLGMIRFFFTKECSEKIQSIIDNILIHFNEEPDGVNFNRQISEVITLILNGLYDVKKHDDIAVGLAVLYVFEKYELLVKIGDRLNKDDYGNYQIPMLLAAAILNGRQNKRHRAKEIAECIEPKFDNRSYKVWIGVAYIYCILWGEIHNYPLMPERMDEELKKSFREKEEFEKIEKALRLAKRAINYLKRLKDTESLKIEYRNRSYYYAINIYIFMITQVGSKKEFESKETRELFQQLGNSQIRREYFQPRYHDTMGRYYLRKAVLAQTERSFSEFIDLALDSNKSSIDESNKKEQFDKHLKDEIRRISAEGFLKR